MKTCRVGIKTSRNDLNLSCDVGGIIIVVYDVEGIKIIVCDIEGIIIVMYYVEGITIVMCDVE